MEDVLEDKGGGSETVTWATQRCEKGGPVVKEQARENDKDGKGGEVRKGTNTPA